MNETAGGAATEELAGRFRDRLGAPVPVVESYGQVAVDVPAARWVAALTVARDELGFDFFDFLTGVDERDEGYSVVTHLYSLGHRRRLLLRTRVPRSAARLASAVEVFPGANWHERETHEMFGVEFTGHPHLVPLLLPDGFEGYPLRKEFMLAARAAKLWPGAKDPGESDRDAPAVASSPGRRRLLPPGVPDRRSWGPRPPGGSTGGRGEPGSSSGSPESPARAGESGGGARSE